MSEPFDDPNLPESLKNGLSALYRTDVRSSPNVDRAILNGARAHLARKRRLKLFIGLAGSVAAAVVFIAIVLIPRGRSITPIAAINGDVNGDGIVDIRDALLLARQLENGKGGKFDLNHDGKTDRGDVDVIALMAVRISPGPDGGAVR